MLKGALIGESLHSTDRFTETRLGWARSGQLKPPHKPEGVVGNAGYSK